VPKNNKWLILFLAALLIIGFFYRIYGLSNNYSFWNDEEHVAIFARAILESNRPVLANGYNTGFSQYLQYWFSAVSAKIFGLNELAIRLPSLIFGVLTIWAVYLLGKELFNRNVGLVAAAFTTFLKIEILWSRQARPYQALQFFLLLGIWFAYKLTKEEKFNCRYLVGFIFSGLLASLMHGLGLVLFGFGFLLFLCNYPSWFPKKWLLAVTFVLVAFTFWFRSQIWPFFAHFKQTNLLFYYRVWLTHHYLLIILLALVGVFLSLFLKKGKNSLILGLFLFFQLLVVSFLAPQPYTRYFYIVFPFLILLAAVGLEGIIPFKKGKNFFFFALAFLIMIFNQKFILWPQKIYSLNADMQEIPEVDYQKIYAFIKLKLEKNPGTVFISNWIDHPVWYLGEGYPHYLLRVNPEGLAKDKFSGAFYLDSLEKLKEVVKNKSHGLILLESWDDRVPEEIRREIRSKFKKELEVDHLYPVQPRLWPVEVYSWGM